mmetsp:Transcript_16410/g.41145  ORF Transcript_16410/g.41145 Transcript_16410/m.41145 type:complete len:197 (-) Transcript_16410:78-668(-)
MVSYGTTPCRTAMSNLQALLRSYNGSNPMSLESLFNNTFDKRIRMNLNGRTYRRDFLLFQETNNFSRRREVYDIVMEVLDSETFHYTYRIEECCDPDEESSCFSSSSASISSTFHSLATVQNGKIVKVKPMTGSAYVELFESNIIYAAEESQRQKQTWEEMELTKPTKGKKCKKDFIRKLSGILSARRSPVVVTAE